MGNMRKIAFIGSGSMTEAIIAGMLAGGKYQPQEIYAGNNSNQDRLSYLARKFGIYTTQSKQDLLAEADIAVLAVKPKDVHEALLASRNHLQKNTLLISVAAGVHTSSLEGILRKDMAIVRAMPNTSAAVGKSATALSANRFAHDKEMNDAITLFETIGTAEIVEEDQLNAVTGLSGSGPAYIYYLAEAMEASIEVLGLEKATAKSLIIQTLIGAAEMLQRSDKSPIELRKEVTSPGGTTEAGLRVLAEYRVQEAFEACIFEAAQQSQRMGQQISMEIEDAGKADR
ncbi:pyrroline-5-carboxylate reductase [Actinomycetes bacterium NPDC127524]